MTEDSFITWYIQYISCEGNDRWYSKELPESWEEWQVRETIPIGGCGDDIAEIISISTTPPWE